VLEAPESNPRPPLGDVTNNAKRPATNPKKHHASSVASTEAPSKQPATDPVSEKRFTMPKPTEHQRSEKRFTMPKGTEQEIREAKERTWRLIKERLTADAEANRDENGNPSKKHLRFLVQMTKAISRMKSGRPLYLFCGKCPVPPHRGDFSLDNLDEDFDYSDNDSTMVFEFITFGLEKKDVIAFNIRDICEYFEKGCCDCSDCEGNEVAFSLNAMGKLADFIGVPLYLVNIGGRSVQSKVMKQVDESFFEKVVKEGVHMSMCVKYRGYSYKSREAQMFAVHKSLHTTCTAINRPENQSMSLVSKWLLRSTLFKITPGSRRSDSGTRRRSGFDTGR
jgi:hypothetical protein